MSKYVKNLISDDVRKRLEGVGDALLVNTIGLDGTSATHLRAELRQKNIQVLVVKNSLAARATEGTPLAPMFEGLTGTSALCWGSEDIVKLAKEITKIARQEQYAKFEIRGGAMDGERLSAAKVAEVAKWPSREEQLSILIGQILGPGARLASQLVGPGGALASQVAEKAKGAEEDAPAAEAAPAAETTPEAPAPA